MTTASESSGSIWLSEARLVDLEQATASPPLTLEIQDGRVAELRAAPPMGEHHVVDCRGLFLMPALTTCHVHLQATYPYAARDPDEPAARTALRAAAHATRLLPLGIATVRTVHEQHQADLRVREAIDRGWARGPRIIAGGRALTAVGGHGDGLGAATASGEDGFYGAAMRELEAGADHIKIFASGGLARAGEALDRPELSQAEMRGAVRAAQSAGTYVVAHAASAQAIRVGLEAGVRCFEHAYLLDSSTAARMAEAKAYLTPTLVVTHTDDWMAAAGFDRPARERSARMAATHLASAKTAIEAGVQILHGTDFPPDGHSSGTTLTVRELELLVAAGLTAPQALLAATRAPASLLGLASTSTSLGRGAPADLIGVADDPLYSVSALRDLRLVMHAGELVVGPRAAGPTLPS
ncbi:MAG TPA: amidohydrolase family protein [Candidatus Limnocylindrales bacterium]|nr:amidohydrolase family protein [Candidatus Limnocylindrales bacterium]